MSDNNLVPLRYSDISPTIVLQEIAKYLDDTEEMFVVTFDKVGTPQIYTSGDIKNMVYAAFVLNGYAAKIAEDGGDI